MTFAENINRICAEKGTSLTALVKTVKGSSSFATAINTKGSLPKESELLEMAKILGCSVMDFFKDDVSDITINQNNNLGKISNHLGSNPSNDTYMTNNYYSDCEPSVKNTSVASQNKELFFELLDKLRNMTDDSLREVIKYADYLSTSKGE